MATSFYFAINYCSDSSNNVLYLSAAESKFKKNNGNVTYKNYIQKIN